MYEIAPHAPRSAATRLGTGDLSFLHALLDSTYECPTCGGLVDIVRRCCLCCDLGIADGSGWPTRGEERDVMLYGWLGADNWRAARLPMSV